MANLSRLPKAIIESYDWQYDGSCANESSDVFFLPDNLRAQAKVLHESRAKAICGSCPVRQRCLEHALSVKEPYGVWGGTSPEDRASILAGESAVPAVQAS